ncbi:MAG: hypothetical protein HQ521_17085 [Bacteroidetes bacterium]|nr:hypothetical protein [Bacteroidota bacterium]
MVSFTKVISKFVLTILVFLLILPGILNAQEDNYLGNEKKIQPEELLAKAMIADFSNSLSEKIYEDSKNSYFAVDVEKLNTKFERIRVLELSYGDDALVSIGTDENRLYYFFLVNNILNKTPEDINSTFIDFQIQATTELAKLNDEQLRLWLLQHEKFSKK